MAITKSIPQIESEIGSLSPQIEKTKAEISSAGGYGGSSIPSFTTVSKEASLKKLQARLQGLEDQRIQQRWYPDAATADAPEATTEPGVMGRTLDFLAAPQRAIVGATMHAMGQSETGSLLGDMYHNATVGKKGFSDVLTSLGAPGVVSSVGGFAADVLTDPVNIATAGSASLLGAIGKGAIKGAAKEGAIKGAALGLTSNLARKATSVGRVTPFFRQTPTFADLAKAAAAKTAEYKTAIGEAEMDFLKPSLMREFVVDPAKERLAIAAANVSKKSPMMKSLLETLPYSNEKWAAMQKATADLKEVYGQDLSGLEKAYAGTKFEAERPLRNLNTDMKEYFNGTTKLVKDFNEADFNAHVAEISKLRKIGAPQKQIQRVIEDLDEAMGILKEPEKYLLVNSQEISIAMLKEALIEREKVTGVKVAAEELVKVLKDQTKIPMASTGVKWYDDAMKSLYMKPGITVKMGKNAEERVLASTRKLMDTWQYAMDIFRFAKVAASPTAFANAVSGNMIFSHMIGEEITDPGFLKRLKLVSDFYSDRPNSYNELMAVIRNSKNAEATLAGIRANPSAFRLMTGGSIPALTTAGEANTAAARRIAKKFKMAPPGKEEEFARIMAQFLPGRATKTQLRAAGFRGFPTTGDSGGMSISDKILKESETMPGAITKPTGLLTTELQGRKLAQQRANIAKKALSSGSFSPIRGVDFVANKMPNAFEKIDQTFKLTSFIRSTVDGYTEKQLATMRNFLKIEPTDLKKVTDELGLTRYTLSAEKAMELAQVTYMNYSAMPSLIKVLRNIPLLGIPFSSFMYANILKTGSTVLNHPESLNKITFALNDFGGTKTPIERKAIYDPSSSGYQYYSYLGQPGMYRLPFFEQNPYYLNFVNMIPPLSNNIFAPDNSKYTTPGVPESIMNVINKSGFFGDPVGQLMKNYLLQPLLLRDELQLKGSFGQPLAPVDATRLEKTAYAVRDLAEAYVPGAAALPLAGLWGVTGLPTDILPLYAGRTLLEAPQGKNPLGKTGKEPGSSRFNRALLGQAGIKVQAPVVTTYTNN